MHELLGCRQVGKAQGFDPCMRWFESSHPSHILIRPRFSGVGSVEAHTRHTTRRLDRLS